MELWQRRVPLEFQWNITSALPNKKEKKKSLTWTNRIGEARKKENITTTKALIPQYFHLLRFQKFIFDTEKAAHL